MPEVQFDRSFAFVFSDNLEDWIKSNYLKRCKKYRENYISKGAKKDNKDYVHKSESKTPTKGRATNLY